MPGPAERSHPLGDLLHLRRSGTVTELLFLYECATREPSQLRPVAERLGLTVQAASHVFRGLARRGLVEVRNGHYRPTVEGVAWLHESLVGLGDDVRGRMDSLHVVRSTRAVAAANLEAGTTVSLEIREGLLTARPGAAGPSRGRAVRAARAGELAVVENLEGIVRISTATVTVRTLSDSDLSDVRLVQRLRGALPPLTALLGADGLEAYRSLSAATDRPIVRFAVAAAALEAARIGVPSTTFVMDRDLPQLLSAFSVGNPPPLDVRPLPAATRSRGRRPGRGGG